MTIDDTQNEIIAEFSELGDWLEKYEYLVDLGKKLSCRHEGLRSERNLVPDCQSQVWLQVTRRDGKIEFCADGRFTNITINNNLDAPIFGDTARTPPMQRIKEGAEGSILENAYRRKILNSPEGVPGAWLALHTPLDGALVLKTKSRPVFTTIKPEDIVYEGRFPRASVRYPHLHGIRLSLEALSSFDLSVPHSAK